MAETQVSAAYRYDWASHIEDQAVARFDPTMFLTSLGNPRDARVYRGEITTDDDYTLPYRLWLPSNPKGAILMVHGACDYAGAFDVIAPGFAQNGYAVVAFDQRGFGRTRTRGKWAGTRRLARDVGAATSFVARRVPDVPVFVVGESMGAALTIRAAAERYLDESVSGLVLVAPGALGCSVRRWAFGLASRALMALGARADVFIERVRCDDLSSDAAIRLLADPLILRRITPSLVGGLVKLGSRAYDLAPLVDVPTLTLAGTREDVSPLHCIRGLQARLQGDATLREFDGGPHLLLHWRERDIVVDAIVAWINERAAPVAASVEALALCANAEPRASLVGQLR